MAYGDEGDAGKPVRDSLCGTHGWLGCGNVVRTWALYGRICAVCLDDQRAEINRRSHVLGTGVRGEFPRLHLKPILTLMVQFFLPWLSGRLWAGTLRRRWSPASPRLSLGLTVTAVSMCAPTHALPAVHTSAHTNLASSAPVSGLGLSEQLPSVLLE